MFYHITIALLEVTQHLLDLAILPLERCKLRLRLLQHILIVVSLFANVGELPFCLLQLLVYRFGLIARCLVFHELIDEGED